MQSLADPAIEVVRNKGTKFVPERFEKTYFNWMENIQDWCISRQLWWGHRIPVFYCKDCGEIMVELEDPTKCCKCGSENIEQDKDVLDTWFSSALWPFSTLGWPDRTDDLEFFLSLIHIFLAVNNIIGVLETSLIFLQTASPSNFGIIISNIAKSTIFSENILRASSPSEASNTLNPSFLK